MWRRTTRMVGSFKVYTDITVFTTLEFASVFSSLIRFHLITNVLYRLGNGNSTNEPSKMASTNWRTRRKRTEKNCGTPQEQNKIQKKQTVFDGQKTFIKSVSFETMHFTAMIFSSTRSPFCVRSPFFFKRWKLNSLNWRRYVSPHIFHPVCYSAQTAVVCEWHGYSCLLQTCTLRERKKSEEASV